MPATMLRWLLLPLGLVVAGTAAYLLLASPGTDRAAAPERIRKPAPSRPAPARSPNAASRAGKPMGEIDDASRRELENVLEGEGVGP
ncbi:MAG: hypothetical protein JRH10_12500 [Deltaproteobacteria bacterium]|nr:hypothetical protein [Deltaproteobacteria bacterium]